MRSNFVFQEIWVGLRRNLTMTVALIVVVAISLSLLGTGLLFVKQVNHTRALWQSRLELSVYLCSSVHPDTNCAKNGPVTTAERGQIAHTLHSLPQVVSFTFQTQKQAYQQAEHLFANEPVMLNFVQPGDLPASFQVKMKNAQSDAGPVTNVVLGQPGVDSVGDDGAILTKFYQLLDGARNAVVVVAIILI